MSKEAGQVLHQVLLQYLWKLVLNKVLCRTEVVHFFWAEYGRGDLIWQTATKWAGRHVSTEGGKFKKLMLYLTVMKLDLANA